MKKEYLFLGGAQHGKRIATYSRCAEFPVMDGMGALWGPQYDPGACLPFRTERYEERRLNLNGTPAAVMAPVGYTDAAASRALADFIEGTQR